MIRNKFKLALAIVVLCLVYFNKFATIDTYFIYPTEYKSIVLSQAHKEQVDPALIGAIILAESKYKRNVTSDSGAVGLMQLMPDTAHWIREQMNKPPMSRSEMTEPANNIAMGTWYVSYLLKEFKGNEILALAAYNAGRGHVEEWVKEYGWGPEFSAIDKIPFGETREYVRKVLRFREKYRNLY